jgi:hypothetical protein
VLHEVVRDVVPWRLRADENVLARPIAGVAVDRSDHDLANPARRTLASGDPQVRQKHLSRPGKDSYVCTRSSPDFHRNCLGSMIPQVANAAPCDFLHIEQWQLPTNLNAPVTS